MSGSVDLRMLLLYFLQALLQIFNILFHMLDLMLMRIQMVSIRFDCLFQAIFNFLLRQIMLLVLCDCYKVVEKLV